jgi:ABC-type uncharacterized transport system substrate-binding protein
MAKRLPELAAELVRLPVDVMLVEGTGAAQVAKQATSSIPIVMGVVAEPVETGLVSNLARPAGNITGFTSLTPEVGTKRLALLKEAFPDMTRVGVLRNPRNPGNTLQLASIKEAAATLSVDVETAEAERRDAISSTNCGSAALPRSLSLRIPSTSMSTSSLSFWSQRSGCRPFIRTESMPMPAE